MLQHRSPPVTTLNEDWYLAVTAKRNRQSTSSDLSRQLSSATGATVSRKTVYRRLGHIGLYARRPVRCVLLTATHCRLRLTWSREHALWTPQQWSCVMFSDESRMARLGLRRNYSWFQNSPACSECNDDRPHLSGCHSGTTCTRLFRAMGAELMFMDDNAHPHRANIVECLQSEDITRMDWPAYAPDLNPIEHVGICLADELQPVNPPT
ncbi:transposable element Tcb1 transposase [Trichonephila clavipes]|nr:transposable element Tcb1 transposase [Trichonephila clavipes]